jgi:hypothetical protein
VGAYGSGRLCHIAQSTSSNVHHVSGELLGKFFVTGCTPHTRPKIDRMVAESLFSLPSYC